MIEMEPGWPVLAGIALALSLVHVCFPWLDGRIRRREAMWMGLIGGIATCYVLLYLLPKIGRITLARVGANGTVDVAFLDLQMYYVLLAAIVTYLAMIHLDRGASRLAPLASAFDYAVHGTYSLLLGYVFVEVSSANVLVNLLIAAILALHLTGMNHLLRSSRTAGFDRAGRWFYFLLVLSGAGLALTTELPGATVDSVTAFLAGIILVNVISEELPMHDARRMPWFLTGIGFYLAIYFAVLTLDPRPAY